MTTYLLLNNCFFSGTVGIDQSGHLILTDFRCLRRTMRLAKVSTLVKRIVRLFSLRVGCTLLKRNECLSTLNLT